MDIIHVYNFVDANGAKLQLNLGVLKEKEGLPKGDAGLRWSFVGTKIPMPVRAHTWFNGFPEPVMLDWLKANGWHLHTDINPRTNNVNVHELPKATEASYENEVLVNAICSLYNGHNIGACRTLYDMTTDAPRTIDYVKGKVAKILADGFKADKGCKYIVDDGEGDYGSLKAYDNYADAWNDYNGLAIAGWPNIQLYRVLTCDDTHEPAKADNWIPVSSGKYPEDGEHVQVTFLSLRTGEPMCHEFAYRDKGIWRWVEDDYEAEVTITAWKPAGEPYREEESK